MHRCSVLTWLGSSALDSVELFRSGTAVGAFGEGGGEGRVKRGRFVDHLMVPRCVSRGTTAISPVGQRVFAL